MRHHIYVIQDMEWQAQAQHALREMVDSLKKNGVKVSYAIHPVIFKCLDMNVLLAEANVQL